MAKKYRVALELSERDELESLLSRGKADVRCLNHARILLKADESKRGPACSDAEIADVCETSIPTVKRVRKRFVEEGIEMALSCSVENLLPEYHHVVGDGP